MMGGVRTGRSGMPEHISEEERAEAYGDKKQQLAEKLGKIGAETLAQQLALRVCHTRSAAIASARPGTMSGRLRTTRL